MSSRANNSILQSAVRHVGRAEHDPITHRDDAHVPLGGVSAWIPGIAEDTKVTRVNKAFAQIADILFSSFSANCIMA